MIDVELEGENQEERAGIVVQTSKTEEISNGKRAEDLVIDQINLLK